MIGIVGLGKMGKLILNGIVDGGVASKKDIILGVRRMEAKKEFENDNYYATLDLNTLFIKCNIIILAVKPQNFEQLASYSKTIDFKNKCIISIIAGIDIEILESNFKNASVYRAMPNTSAEIKRSVTTICYRKRDEYLDEAKKILGTIGIVVEVGERVLDLAVPLNGSMPAFIYLFVKDFIDTAVKNGIDFETSKKLVLESVEASIEVLKQSERKISEHIIDVCSKGGITLAGMNELYKNGFDDSIKACYQACLKRSEELKAK